MFDNLVSLGYGLVSFAIVIGVGSVVLNKFGGATSGCGTYNVSTDLCQGTGQNVTFTNQTTPTSTSWTNTNYLNTQLGTAGLAGWAPAIIAFVVGMLFLGAFLVKKGRNY